jgi:hypothetical protein
MLLPPMEPGAAPPSKVTADKRVSSTLFQCPAAFFFDGLSALRPSCAAPADGSLSPDSCRARRMLLMAESGQKLPFVASTKRPKNCSMRS